MQLKYLNKKNYLRNSQIIKKMFNFEKNDIMNWIKKNLLWIVVGFLVYKNWDKVSAMIGMKKPEETDSAKAIDEGMEDDLA